MALKGSLAATSARRHWEMSWGGEGVVGGRRGGVEGGSKMRRGAALSPP